MDFNNLRMEKSIVKRFFLWHRRNFGTYVCVRTITLQWDYLGGRLLCVEIKFAPLRTRVGTGPAVRLRSGQDRTKSSSGRTKPDFFRFFCRIDLKNDPAGFLPDWRQKWSGRISTGPDRTNFEAGRTGPDAKNPSGSNSATDMGSEMIIRKYIQYRLLILSLRDSVVDWLSNGGEWVNI